MASFTLNGKPVKVVGEAQSMLLGHCATRSA